MNLAQSLSIALKVLSDWRVLFIALAAILVWAALRYVGIVYSRAPRSKPRASAPKPRAAAKPSRPKPPPPEADDEVIE